MIFRAAIVVVALLAGQAHAQASNALPVAREASWGCQILLCLAVPAGWRTVSYCVPPVTQLIRSLRKGGRFPVCSEASANGSARLVTRYFQLCPTGYREPNELGFPDPEAFAHPSDDSTPPNKVCYGRYLGREQVFDSETGISAWVDKYDTVSLSPVFQHGALAYEFFEGNKLVSRLFIGSAL